MIPPLAGWNLYERNVLCIRIRLTALIQIFAFRDNVMV